jgi:hypothetical protein
MRTTTPTGQAGGLRVQPGNINERDRYLLFHDLSPEGPLLGEVSAWPSHLTLVSFFYLGRATLNETIDTVHEVARLTEPVGLSVVRSALYGPNYSIPVGEVTNSPEIRRLHYGLLGALGEIGCEIIDRSYMFARYSPHITKIPGVKIPEEFVVDALSLGKKQKAAKCIEAVVPLGRSA